METLICMAFDNLSSNDQLKIRKGLRQIEGLLAQICLSSPSAEKRRSIVEYGKEPSPPRPLDQLTDDPAFLQFFKLQNGFECNIISRLLNCLDRLLGKAQEGTYDLLIIQTLDLCQGVMLLHPPSRSLFAREAYMEQLLDLLEPVNCPAIQSTTIITLVCALIDTPKNTRTFEKLEGLLVVTSIFKSRETTREVKLKLVEFLYFYLMPETPSIPTANSTVSVPQMLQRSPSKLAGAFNRVDTNRKRSDSGSDITKTTEEKQFLLGRFLNSVDELVADLRESTPFGGAVC
ncbi:hypothetical protein HYFRA_00003239 [Hymenoscyphus fraxineus]|uniref:Cell division control protein 14 n=1 Tax=Hymenoscyphus fraxineus TaxID=746836 RepID=A0A9N9PRF0_9HELO|nr:hypothetical protein HYFRA_00003239 [Hymenoscyphus fraxineus]